MKQALVLLIIFALFSFMEAATKACPPNSKIVCTQSNITTCRCASKGQGGTFAVSHSCNAPQHPLCEGNPRTVNCRCVG